MPGRRCRIRVPLWLTRRSRAPLPATLWRLPFPPPGLPHDVSPCPSLPGHFWVYGPGGVRKRDATSLDPALRRPRVAPARAPNVNSAALITASRSSRPFAETLRTSCALVERLGHV